AQHLAGARAAACARVACRARRTGRPATAAVERISAHDVHARSGAAHRRARHAHRAAHAGVADLARLAGHVAAGAVLRVGRDAAGYAAEQLPLALTLSRLAGVD